MKKYLLVAISFAACLCSCHPPERVAPEETPVASTPVTISKVEFGSISDSLELNASSTYLQNSYVKSIAAGYKISAG